VANSTSDKETCQTIIQNFQCSGKVTEFFDQKAKDAVTYSSVQHTATETRVEIVCWVCENLHPFNVIKDRGFICLMKTGRPNYYIPLPSTIGHDVKKVFARVRKQIMKML